MQYYYQFRAVIAGGCKVGKKTLLNRLDPQTDGNKIILSDQLSSTLYIYEFLHCQEYCADALCFVILFDQSNQETLNFALKKIQIILQQLNRGFQFIILVQNKIDLPSKINIDIHDYATNNQINLITLSAKTEFNVQLFGNILKLKAQQTMTKCSLSPYPLRDSLVSTPRNRENTPDRPLPETPQSQCKSIRSEVVQIEDFEISQIQNSLKKLDIKIENKLEQTVRNDNLPKRTPLKEIDQTNRKNYTKGIMNIVFTLNGQHHPVEIYREDSYGLIVERLVQILNRRLKPLQKKHLIKIVEGQMNDFLNQLTLAAGKPKQSSNIEKLFNHFNGLNNQIKQQIVGQIVLVIKQNIFKINISKSDDAYEIAFNSIMEFNLKRNSIQTLVDKIQIIQNPKNSTYMWVICDFIQQDLVIYVGENVDKYEFQEIYRKIFQFTMQHKLEYEQYKLLQLIN